MKWRKVDRLIILVAATNMSVMSQNPVVMGSGYDYPNRVHIAPGQLVTFYLDGTTGASFARAPDNQDLPTTLSIFSVTMNQFEPLPEPSPRVRQLRIWQLPILEVRPYFNCYFPPDLGSALSPCFTRTAAVTVQIPYEVESAFDTCSDCRLTEANLSFVFRGNQRSAIGVVTLPDKVHILRAFDSVLPITTPRIVAQCGSLALDATSTPLNATGLPCPALIYHGDGSIVTVEQPAHPGEELVVYAVGLGRTNPDSVTGRVVKVSSPTVTTFGIDFNYRPNVLATRPRPVDPSEGQTQNAPLYTGTVEGSVGVYQVRFQVPPVPAGTVPCAKAEPVVRFPYQTVIQNVVYSNLTVSIGGKNSFDGAGICVAVDAPDGPEETRKSK